MAKYTDLTLQVKEKYQYIEAEIGIYCESIKTITWKCLHGKEMMRMSSSKTPTFKCAEKPACQLILDGSALDLFFTEGYIKWSEERLINGNVWKVWKLKIPICNICSSGNNNFTVTLSTFSSEKTKKYLSYRQPFFRCCCTANGNKFVQQGSIIQVVGNPKLEQSWNMDKIYASSSGDKPEIDIKGYDFSNLLE